MHIDTLQNWQHNHDFTVLHQQGERRTSQVLLLTAVTMVIEIAAGLAYGSMALLADGWHMATHVAAFAITLFAYRYARRHVNSGIFAFGPGKVGVLGGFASAVALAMVSLIMVIESAQRILAPQPIHFNEAIGVALLGLVVNLVCALLLDAHHDHDHANSESQTHGHHTHHDHNLKAAYFHVLADAFTSLLAIFALLAGKYLGFHWLDPLMGIIGAAVITRWAYGLLRETSPILLDGSMDQTALAGVKAAVEAALDTRVADLHVWRVGPADYAAILTLVTHYPQSVDYYKQLLHDVPGLSHITIEIHPCPGEPCLPL